MEPQKNQLVSSGVKVRGEVLGRYINDHGTPYRKHWLGDFPLSIPLGLADNFNMTSSKATEILDMEKAHSGSDLVEYSEVAVSAADRAALARCVARAWYYFNLMSNFR
jgi:hypothetical protein